jgi:hypothetical protein
VGEDTILVDWDIPAPPTKRIFGGGSRRGKK